MNRKNITSENIDRFQKYLTEEEKSDATKEKYIRDVKAFALYLKNLELCKETVISYKQHLQEAGYAVRSINSMLASLNCFFIYFGCPELKVKSLRLQQAVFCPEEKELTRKEYERLCYAAQRKHNERLYLILQAICSTGIRISELSFITVEAVQKGKAVVTMKGKTRSVFLPKKLQKKLLRYISGKKIAEGSVFVTRTGKPISRTNIWREMKSLCSEADVKPCKVYPHNLRHLFASIFYSLEKDIVKLADVLGHSSVETTRIYIISSGAEHRRCMEKMCLVI